VNATSLALLGSLAEHQGSCQKEVQMAEKPDDDMRTLVVHGFRATVLLARLVADLNHVRDLYVLDASLRNQTSIAKSALVRAPVADNWLAVFVGHVTGSKTVVGDQSMARAP
jgi:hypothetical protein